MRLSGCAVFFIALSFVSVARAAEQEFSDQIVRNFDLRSEGTIHLTNLHGNIVVLGWPQDMIQVRASRRVFADNEQDAKAAFSTMDLRFHEKSGDIECSAEYGRGLDIKQRLAQLDQPVALQPKMDLVIYAPSRMPLKVWTSAGTTTLKNWGNKAELRTISGDISAVNFKGKRLSTLCQNCTVNFDKIKGSIRTITDGGNVSIKNVEGPEVYVETGAGKIEAFKVSSDQLYVSRNGAISGSELHGSVDFQTDEGPVDFSAIRGFASGKTKSAPIHLNVNHWVFHDKALIESASGDISISLPRSFAAEVDLESGSGQVRSAFPVQQSIHQKATKNHLVGRIGEQTTDLFKVFSGTGNVDLLRQTP